MIVFVAMAALLAIVPAIGIYPFFVTQALCFALLACAFNLLIGFGGLLSFGHAMFLGTAGYVTAHLLKVGQISLPYWVGHSDDPFFRRALKLAKQIRSVAQAAVAPRAGRTRAAAGVRSFPRSVRMILADPAGFPRNRGLFIGSRRGQ